MSRKIKEKRFNIQLVNLKLLSNTRSGDNVYKEIISKINKNKISVPVRGGKNAILRTLFSDQYIFNNDNYEILYGKFSKFTIIDGKDWINLDTMDVENVEVPENKFPNLVETDYVFIPDAHRFIIVTTQSVNIGAVETFMKFAIKEVINSDEDFEVVVEQSEDIFEEIRQAEEIHKLLIRISYTNADTGSDAFDFMDQQLKESKIGRLSMEISPDHNKNINTESTLISGALQVAQSNGFAEATVKINGQRKTIDTKLHPRRIPLQSEETNFKKKIFDTVMNLFRNNNGKSEKQS
jgi:hypothetical protein